jgi:phenylacetate-CoA ligase
MIVGNTDLEKLRYSLEKASSTTEFWNKKIKELNIEPEESTMKTLESLVDELYITPTDLYKEQLVWPKYIKDNEIYHLILLTSGTTGAPKRIPLTTDDEKRIARQAVPWKKYFEKMVIASFLPPLPSASGYMGLEGIKTTKIRYYQLPIQLLQDKNMLSSMLERIAPTSIWGLPTTVYNLAEMLPEKIKKDIRILAIGGEELPETLATKISKEYYHASILDVYGTSEDCMGGYRIYENQNFTPFEFPESLIVLKDGEDVPYKEIYLTKLLKENELTGLFLFNYKIGDLAEVRDDKVVKITRGEDCISLAGAKLHLSQISEIVHRYDELKDYVVIYYPIGEDRKKPMAIIRVGYTQKIPGIEDEIRSYIYESNNPARYEVEESKMANLIIEAVEIEKLREGLPSKPGKPKRLYKIV